MASHGPANSQASALPGAEPGHGPTNASTAADHGGGHAPEPTLLGLSGAWFVAAAMLAVIALLIWKRVPTAIGKALDEKIGTIRQQLDEAAQLRAEAEALRSEYEAKSAQADAEAATMLERARTEAAGIVAQAETDAAALVERRTRMAEDKIAAAERAAVDSVRARVATAAAAAAESLIRDRLDAEGDRALVDTAIQSLGSR